MNLDLNNEVNNRLAKQWEKSTMTFAAYAAKKHVPLGGTFELTPRCNLRCKMCYVRLDQHQMDQIGRELTADEWIGLAKEAADAGTLNLLLTGGEPLLRDDFQEIFAALTHMGFIITVNTNATLMTPELMRFFQKYPPTTVNVTLYGASPETYGKICGNPDGFDQTIRGLELLLRVPTVLEIHTTFIRDNQNELDQLREIGNKYSPKFAINPLVMQSRRGAVSDAGNCRMQPSELCDLIERNWTYYKKMNKPLELEHDLMKTMDADHSDVDYGFDLPPKSIHCLAAKAMYWITWDGKMLPCCTFSSPYTLPVQEGFRTAWERLPSLFEEIPEPAECRDCSHAESCLNCPAMLQTETGSFDKISPYICEIAEKLEILDKNISKGY